MIVHELKTVFVHIPKTAGVSLVHALISEVLGYDTSGGIKDLSTDIKNHFDLRGPQKHKQARDYVPTDISKQLWDKYYKFAIVRNPWDRAVSEYHWRRAQDKHRPSDNFKEFLDHCEKRLAGKEKGIYWTHAQTQKSYVTNKKGKIILDDIFKLEDIDNGVKVISEKLNIPIILPKYNTSNHDHYRTYYNDETKAIVRRLYKDDIEMFDYEF